uniref:UDP-glycosyltransferases domain-containing protein n=1 Tax=Fagus sylvatica TaxID=28930 RepID=A0A2N9J4L0_FAGSY
MIFVVTGSGQGHLNPSMELCNHLVSRNYHTTLIIPSTLSSSIPSSFSQNPLTSILHITGSSLRPPIPGSDPLTHQSALDLHAHLANQSQSQPQPLCAIVDFQMGWTKKVFWKFNIPVISFFTFGACAAAMEWGAWKSHIQLGEDEAHLIPGLPEEMAITSSDLKRRSSPGPPRGGGPPKPGDRPPWVPEVEGSIALMFNTCDDLERPFIEYMRSQMGMPAWGVGPLLPEQYWKSSSSSSSSIIRDRLIRQHDRESNYTEEEVIQWPSPKSEGFLADGLDSKVGERGLIIRGWAPQLLILSHPSTGGFLSHCGWNSTAEAIGRGVPFLAWPIRGDQYYNAKLLVNHLKVGYRVAQDLSEMVKKEDILKGIQYLMADQHMHKRAAMLRAKFENGFPPTSQAAFDAFINFITQQHI